jgi:mRNA interferase MazF
VALRDVNRGDLWTVAGGSGHTSKPRPAVIVQDDRFDALDSVVLCPLTTDPTDVSLFRLPVVPSVANGLRDASRIMIDKIAAVPRARLGDRIGRLTEAQLAELNRALVVFLGIAAPLRRR